MANYNQYLIAGGALLAGVAAYAGYKATRPQPKLYFNWRRPRDGKSQFHVFRVKPVEGSAIDLGNSEQAKVRSAVGDVLSEGDRVGIYTPGGTLAMEATVTKLATVPNKGRLVEVDKAPDATKSVAGKASKESPGYLKKLPLKSIV